MRYLLVLASTLFSFPLFAQHCPFDNMAILVVRVTDVNTGEQLQPPLIQLVDARGTLQMNWKEEPLVFTQNPAQTDPDWGNGMHFERVRYSFAQDWYILPLSYNWKEQDVFLEIDDPEDDLPPVRLPITEEDFFNIHENIGDWTETFYTAETPKVSFTKLIQVDLDGMALPERE